MSAFFPYITTLISGVLAKGWFINFPLFASILHCDRGLPCLVSLKRTEDTGSVRVQVFFCVCKKHKTVVKPKFKAGLFIAPSRYQPAGEDAPLQVAQPSSLFIYIKLHNFELHIFPQLNLDKTLNLRLCGCVFLILKAGVISSSLNSLEEEEISKDNFTWTRSRI